MAAKMERHTRAGRPLGSSAGQFRITRFEDLEDSPIKNWLVRGLLGSGDTISVYGQPGVGKSVLVGDLAVHVAAGLSWFGHEVMQGGAVYVAAERGAVVKRRLVALCSRLEVEKLPLIVTEGTFDFASSASLDFAHVFSKRVKSEMESYGVDVKIVIIDTKNRVFGGGDPNSDVDAAHFIATIDAIKQPLGDPLVIIVDHVPHLSPQRMKGSGVVAGAIDGSLLLTKGSGQERLLSIGSKPMNDGPERVNIKFTIESQVVGHDDDGVETTTAFVAPVTGNLAGSRRHILPKGAVTVAIAYRRLLKTNSVPNTSGEPWVPYAELREMAFNSGLSRPEPPASEDRRAWQNARNKAWSRALDDLGYRNLLVVKDGLVRILIDDIANDKCGQPVTFDDSRLPPE